MQQSNTDERPEAQHKAVAIIPARYASERLPGKPLAEIHGKPMVQHVYERVSRASLVTRVVVATDDERIAAAVRAFGGEAVMTPVDCKSGSDRIALVAESMHDIDIVVNVQGDEPLIHPSMIDDTIRPLHEEPALRVCTVVREISDAAEVQNPNVVKVVLDLDGFCLYFSRSPVPHVRGIRQEAWLAHQKFFKHFGLYVFRRSFLLRYAAMPPTPLEQSEKLEQLRILEHGYRMRAVITEYDSMPVDTREDLERVRTLVGAA